MDYARPNPEALDTSDSPSVSQAAADLRHAAADKARETAQDVQSKAQQLKSAAAEKAQQFRSYAGDKATALKHDATQKAHQVKDVTTQKFNQSCDKAKDLHSSAEDYVRANPTKSVLGALGVGLVIGLIARR